MLFRSPLPSVAGYGVAEIRSPGFAPAGALSFVPEQSSSTGVGVGSPSAPRPARVVEVEDGESPLPPPHAATTTVATSSAAPAPWGPGSIPTNGPSTQSIWPHSQRYSAGRPVTGCTRTTGWGCERGQAGRVEFRDSVNHTGNGSCDLLGLGADPVHFRGETFDFSLSFVEQRQRE